MPFFAVNVLVNETDLQQAEIALHFRSTGRIQTTMNEAKQRDADSGSFKIEFNSLLADPP